MSNSSSNSGAPAGAAVSIISIVSESPSSSITGSGSGGGGADATLAAGFGVALSTATAGAFAIGVGTPYDGLAGSSAGSIPAVLIKFVICASSGDRAPGCTAIAMNRASTSSAADNDAADVCALSIEGSAFVGFELPHAATMSATA